MYLYAVPRFKRFALNVWGVDPAGKTLTLEIQVDTAISSPMEYLEIFMKRMLLCRSAAEKLNLRFSLRINGQTLI